MKKPKIGETYYFEDRCSYFRGNRYVEVTKVGRKFFYADGMRFRLENGYEDGGDFCGRGQLYDDEDDYSLSKMADSCKKVIPSLLVELSAQDVVDVYKYIKSKKGENDK